MRPAFMVQRNPLFYTIESVSRVLFTYDIKINIILKEITMIKYIKKFNNKFAIILTNMVSTMACSYVFAAIALISLPEAINGGIATFIAWFAQTFLQLVLLSVIMVGQEIQSKKTERRAAQDHAMITEQLKQIKEMHTDIHLLITSTIRYPSVS